MIFRQISSKRFLFIAPKITAEGRKANFLLDNPKIRIYHIQYIIYHILSRIERKVSVRAKQKYGGVKPMKKVYDLSVTIANYGYDPRPAEIEYRNHKDNARYYAGTTGVDPSAFPDGEALNTETLTILTHTGTHLDAPWHYGTQSEGKPAMTIDDVPLEWCYGDGVVLDFRHKGPQDVIDVADLEEELKRIGYTLKPGDIPCIMCLGGDRATLTVA